jgi:small subunit ribosomal protein S3
MRMGITRSWSSKWFSNREEYKRNLKEDVKIRDYIVKELREAGVHSVDIERNASKIKITINTAKPGSIIGRGGKGADDLRKKIKSLFLKTVRLANIDLAIAEIDRPNLSAQVVAQAMAIEIEKRMPFRRVMKQAIGRVERAGALGVKVMVGGRLNGAEIARTEKLVSGKVPLHTLRADIDYALATAFTTYGSIGVKCWIYKGEVFKKGTEEKGEVLGSRK